MLLASCRNAEKKEIKIHRIDLALIMTDTLEIDNQIQKLYSKYPDFFSDYIAEVMSENPADTARVIQELKKFCTDKNFQRINNEVTKVIGDTKLYESLLGSAFGKMQKEFPQIKIPEIYFFVSGFNRSLLVGDNYIGVGTDLFLGADFPDYKDMTYKYMTLRMTPSSIPVEILSHIIYEYIPPMNDERLLESLIFHGKVQYILSELMPDYNDEQIIGYSDENIKWCTKFEKEIWATIVEQKHLFSSDVMLINKYTVDGPFTSPVSQESPGRLGVWVGWQIVKSYMNHNRKTGLNELLNNTNASEILENSAYKP